MTLVLVTNIAARAHSTRGLLAAGLALVMWLSLGSGTVHADRWGPPYQAYVVVDRTAVYEQPDRASKVVGPLWRDAIAVVLAEKIGSDGSGWVQIPDGYLPASDVAERYAPWTAEVSVPSVSLYAYPFVASGVMHTSARGDLLRVMGVSRGLEGDQGIYWATTEGYAPLGTLKWATNDWASWWKLPAASDAPNGWWAILVQQAHVRVAPNTEAPAVGVFGGGEYVKVLADAQGEPIDGNPLWYRIDGGRYAGGYIHSTVVKRVPAPKPNTRVPAGGSPDGSWIVVDRAAFSLTFVKDGKAAFVTYVALGKAGVDTPSGVYTIFGKFVGDRMSSRQAANPTHPYDLPLVPFTEYYKDGGYAIHGTYWHDLFGTRESQGCINLTWADSAYLFGLTLPSVEHGSVVAWGQPGGMTPVLILD